MKKPVILLLWLSIGIVSRGAGDRAAGDRMASFRAGDDNAAAAALTRAERAVTDVMVHDIFSPPVAARIYLYTNVAAYETMVKAYPEQYRSLYGQVASFPRIPGPRQTISYPLAAVYSFLLVGRNLVFSESVLADSINNILASFDRGQMGSGIYAASLRYGRQVADSVIAWAGGDRYKETRGLPRYRILKAQGKWIPTPPVYMAAVEPYWNRIRPVTLDSADQFRPAPAPVFSRDTASFFYRQAHEVYNAVNRLTQEQRAIANFWDCNPFAVTMEGHLGFSVKKISPGGHWVEIAGTVCRQQHRDIMETSAAYTIASIAIFDAFISCWDEKYRSNVIRPETYIDSYIDESWRPILQTPPFPEYTSGHSIISSAAATVLGRYLGDQSEFDDDAEVEFGLPGRHFASFNAAAQEAAISRFYGGIHYRAAIDAGVISGRQIGDWILKKINLKKQG
jgi:hypothetical protein